MLKQGKFSLDIRRKTFTVMAVKQWNRLCSLLLWKYSKLSWTVPWAARWSWSCFEKSIGPDNLPGSFPA